MLTPLTRERGEVRISPRITSLAPAFDIEQWQRAGEIGGIPVAGSVLRLEQQNDLWREVGNHGGVSLDRVGDRPANRRVAAANPRASFPRLPKNIHPPTLVQGTPPPRLMQLGGRVIDGPDTTSLARQTSGAEPRELRQSRADGAEAGARDDDLKVIVSP
jgi:hypothetical protein